MEKTKKKLSLTAIISISLVLGVIAGLLMQGIALVAGIDRILDMGRTVVNITGDAACAVCVNHWDKNRKVIK